MHANELSTFVGVVHFAHSFNQNLSAMLKQLGFGALLATELWGNALQVKAYDLSMENNTSCSYTVEITWKKVLCPTSCGTTAETLTIAGNSTLNYDAPGSNEICSVKVRSGLTVLSTWSCQTGATTWTPSNPTACGGYVLWFHGYIYNCKIDYT